VVGVEARVVGPHAGEDVGELRREARDLGHAAEQLQRYHAVVAVGTVHGRIDGSVGVVVGEVEDDLLQLGESIGDAHEDQILARDQALAHILRRKPHQRA